ncbi:hypothetical protein ACFYKX_11575 [Cytobacillus sp. FJAT-54145]|uniref:Uncharacterized protein n=1 Tax=Cytobacillus spartinae TaxID=3299023 RepID=A0ABW6KAK6_9BACI
MAKKMKEYQIKYFMFGSEGIAIWRASSPMQAKQQFLRTYKGAAILEVKAG